MNKILSCLLLLTIAGFVTAVEKPDIEHGKYIVVPERLSIFTQAFNNMLNKQSRLQTMAGVECNGTWIPFNMIVVVVEKDGDAEYAEHLFSTWELGSDCNTDLLMLISIDTKFVTVIGDRKIDERIIRDIWVKMNTYMTANLWISATSEGIKCLTDHIINNFPLPYSMMPRIEQILIGYVSLFFLLTSLVFVLLAVFAIVTIVIKFISYAFAFTVVVVSLLNS